MKLFSDSASGLGQYVVVLTLWAIREGWYVSVREATESTREPLLNKASCESPAVSTFKLPLIKHY